MISRLTIRKSATYTHSDYETLQKLKFLVQHKNLSFRSSLQILLLRDWRRNRSASRAHNEHTENEENNRSLIAPQASKKSLLLEVLGALADQFKQQQEVNNQLLGIIEEYKSALKWILKMI